jgi:D-glycerate 3-kinase
MPDHRLSAEDRLDHWLDGFMAREHLPPGFAETVRAVCEPLAGRIAGAARGTGFTVGICGTQASGKSTLTAVIARLLEGRGLSVAVLSLDDLYLTRAERRRLAAEVHPLFATRGVPGTHDVALGERVLDALKGAGEVALPSFDKAADDRRPSADWPGVRAPVDVILFEGWCVGARSQPPAALVQPLNALERDEDAHGVWRAYANTALAGDYQTLFARLDLFVLLQAPSFEVVLDWRREQERKLRERLARDGAGSSNAMSDEAVARFIAHYERITRWILEEAPGRADVVVRLDAERRPI